MKLKECAAHERPAISVFCAVNAVSLTCVHYHVDGFSVLDARLEISFNQQTVFFLSRIVVLLRAVNESGQHFTAVYVRGVYKNAAAFTIGLYA